MDKPTPALDAIRQPLQRRFLAAFSACGSIIQAARWAKISRATHYFWMQNTPEYPAAFEESEIRAMRSLEDEAVRRAHQGIRKAVRYKGKIVGYETEFSDQLLQFLLKGGNRQKFGDRAALEHSAPGGGPIEVSIGDSARAKILDRVARVAIRIREASSSSVTD